MENRKINKPSIIIASAGRTGTLFFANLFQECIKNIDSFHMPDREINLFSASDWRFKIKGFGIANLTLDKLFGKFGVRFLSDKVLASEYDDERVFQLLARNRYNFIKNLPGDYYAESNPTLYGLLPYMEDFFTNVRFAFIVRNGYDWVTSHMNWGAWYNENKFNNYFVRRLEPGFFSSDSNVNNWNKYDRFQKLCWAWNKINSKAISDIEPSINGRLVRFEDIFQSESKTGNLKHLLIFLTQHLKGGDIDIDKALKLVNMKVHKNISYGFPTKESWDSNMYAFFNDLCGSTMTKFGYDLYE